jgi:hypothetical protein
MGDITLSRNGFRKITGQLFSQTVSLSYLWYKRLHAIGKPYVKSTHVIVLRNNMTHPL